MSHLSFYNSDHMDDRIHLEKLFLVIYDFLKML